MGDPIETTNTASSATGKIAIPRNSLEKLIRGLLASIDNGWQIDIKLDDGLPKALVLIVHKLLKSVRETVEKQEEQINALSHANVRVLFLNEALGLINDITDECYKDGSHTQKYNQVLDDVMHATTSSLSVMFFIDESSSISELYYQGMKIDVPETCDACIKMIGMVASKFIENDNHLIMLNNEDEYIDTLPLPEGHPDIESMIMVPIMLRTKKQMRGVLYVANKRDGLEFNNNDATVCELIAAELSNVYDRISLTRQLKKEKEEQGRLLQEIQNAQDQLLQSEKMASIGQLAAGVAHEINNPVGYINSNINSMQNYINDIFELIEQYQQIEQYLPEDHKQTISKAREDADLEYLKEDVIDLVNESIEGVTRVKQIVNDLKNFSRVDESEWEWADLHSGIDSTLNIVHNEIKYKAEIEKHYDEIPEVWCIASQINQVIMNMLVNAAHAIEDRGVIKITTGCRNDDMVYVSIADSGCGIPEEKLARIFDPFYTSKPVGEGTGLGLSLSFSIIEKHNGTIEVKSEPGKGTEFTILLPIKQPH